MVKGSNGYLLFVFGAPAHKGRPASVLIFATRGKSGAIYSAPASVDETSIQADLGALGEVAVSFHPSGQRETVRSECGGRPVSFDSGYYEGSIVFRGEEDYTVVNATRAGGNLDFLRNICPSSSGGVRGPFFPGAQLDVYADGSKAGPHLKVVKNHATARAHFEAGVSEAREGVSILRVTSAFAPAGSFEFDPNVQTATVRPPAPFAGAARFRRTRNSTNRWTGNLTVDLPGRSGVRLTGVHARAKLAHARWDFHLASESGT